MSVCASLFLLFCLPDICHRDGYSRPPTSALHPIQLHSQTGVGLPEPRSCSRPPENPERPMRQALPPLQKAQAGRSISIANKGRGEQNYTKKLRKKRDLPFAATPRLAEPLLTKNELGTNSSSESESGVGWATPLPSNRLWLSLAGGEGGGEGDCSIGVDEADEQCKGAPANHKDKHRQKKIMKIGFEAHKEEEGAK